MSERAFELVCVCIDSVNVDFVLVGCNCNLFCVVNNMLDEKDV